MIEVVATVTTVIALTMSYFVYKSYADTIAKVIFLPMSIFCAVALSIWFMSLAGQPIHRYPQSEFVYVSHRIDSTGEWIYLWASDKETGHRLYKFPYERPTAEKLSEGKQKMQEGDEVVIGEFKFSEGRRRRPTFVVKDPDEFLYERQLIPKEGEQDGL